MGFTRLPEAGNHSAKKATDSSERVSLSLTHLLQKPFH